MLQFWKNVKSELEYKTMTQRQLADSIKVSYNTIQSWITKDRLPDAEQAVKIAHALQTSVEYLVTGTHSKESLSENRHIISEIKQKINTVIDGYLNK